MFEVKTQRAPRWLCAAPAAPRHVSYLNPHPPLTRRVQMEFAVADEASGRNFEFAGEAAIIARCPAPPTPLPPPWTARRLDSSSPGQLNTSSLPGVLNEWCANPAEVTYGHISTWDVSLVTDMQYLFTSASCYNTFNADINGWDVGQVTTMEVRHCPASQSQNSCAHTAAQGGGHKLCVCAGAAQNMFQNARAFNQPLAAWDVGQVTSMQVRRRPASGFGAPAHTQLLSGAVTSRVLVTTCVRVLAAQYMFRYASAFNQPLAAWDVGQVTTMQVRCPPASGSQASCRHTHTAAQGAVRSRVRVLAWRRACSISRVLSTSLWMLGTLARSPTCRCAAALCVIVTGLLHAQLLRAAATSRVRVLARRSICSTARAPSTSPWKLGMSARS